VKYNHKTPLTEEQVMKLSETELFEYLDSKALYLKKFSEPLGEYHAKNFMAMSKGSGSLSDDELKLAKQIGRKGDDFRADRIIEAAKSKSKVDLKSKVKRNRREWID
jgi:hypothetical protein